MAEKTHEELVQALEEKKAELKAKREELATLEKEYKLKPGKDHSADEKVGKKWLKLKNSVDALAEERNKLQEAVKTSKPKKEKTVKPSKYEYPADVVTPEQKKKWRASQRAEKKKANKPEKAEKAEKVKEKKSEEVVDKKEKKDKKDKKDKKAKKNED
jgi:hypothetical protein